MAANSSNLHNLTTLIKRYVSQKGRGYNQRSQSITMASRYSPGQPLTTLLLRLEAATSRLEDIATSVDSTHPETIAAISTAQATIAENAAAAALPVAAAPPPEPLPRSIEDFDNVINEDVKEFVAASEAVGGLVQQQVSGRFNKGLDIS
jgi:hypothetical protein